MYTNTIELNTVSDNLYRAIISMPCMPIRPTRINLPEIPAKYDLTFQNNTLLKRHSKRFGLSIFQIRCCNERTILHLHTSRANAGLGYSLNDTDEKWCSILIVKRNHTIIIYMRMLR